MTLRCVCTGSLLSLVFLVQSYSAPAHPLRLSLSEIEYSDDQQVLTINLRLFLTDVNEALVFDPYSTELAFCQSNESPHAERLLLEYLNQYFYVKANGAQLALQIKSKQLKGEGDDTTLGVLFEYQHPAPLKSLEIMNAVFTDLFFDQSNIVYVHVNDSSKSLMLNKNTSTHRLRF